MTPSNRQRLGLANLLMDCGKYFMTSAIIGCMFCSFVDDKLWICLFFLSLGFLFAFVGYVMLGDVRDDTDKPIEKKKR